MANSSFVFLIDGLDITSYIAEDGIKWQREDIDGPNSGRTMSGLLIRDRVATKIRLDITCRALEQTECSQLLNAIYPEFVTVQYIDPMYGQTTKTMYSNNNPAVLSTVFDDGTLKFTGITFPLIER